MKPLATTHADLYMPVRPEVLGEFAAARGRAGLSVAEALEEALRDWSYKLRGDEFDEHVVAELAPALADPNPSLRLRRVAAAIRRCPKYWHTTKPGHDGLSSATAEMDEAAVAADWPFLEQLIAEDAPDPEADARPPLGTKPRLVYSAKR